MYISIQSVCGCHGYLIFESVHCDRCRSLIPFQVTDESLVDPSTTNNLINGVDKKALHASKRAPNTLVSYGKHHLQQQQQALTVGRIRFRTLCPFCNSPTYVLRYYCKRERIYYHLRTQTFSENEHSVYQTVAETQQMNLPEKYTSKQGRKSETSLSETIDDSYSLSGSISQQAPSTIIYDRSGLPNARDTQINTEKTLYGLNDLEGDLFSVLRNGLFHDTLVQCLDEVKLQVHRCILGGRSPWFRRLLAEHHDANIQEDYVLQISIDDVKSDVMNEILNFMYTNRCLISIKNAPELLIAAKRFELEKLKKQISDFLLSRLNVDNAIETLISAHEAGSEVLKQAAIRVINRNADKIKRTERWKSFKIQYVDLVPELYESRMERPAPVPVAFLPDVFSGPVLPSESLLTLSQLYDNPVKQRLPSPSPRILLPPGKAQQTVPPAAAAAFQTVQHTDSNQPITKGTSGPFNQRNGSSFSFSAGHESPTKKRVMGNTRQRPAPAPAAAPPLTRTVFPTGKLPSDADAYRRPVNVHEKSVALPAQHQKRQSVNNQTSRKPPPPSPTKAMRAPTPEQHDEMDRSSTRTDTPLEERSTSA